jgi:TonB family protein
VIKKILIASIFLLSLEISAQTDFKNETSTSQNQDVAAVFDNRPGGVNKFREEIAKRIDLSGYQWKQGFTVIFSFVVNADGKTEDVKAEKSSGIQEFDDRFIYAIKSLKKKWTPAKVNGVTVKSRFKIPFNISAMN